MSTGSTKRLNVEIPKKIHAKIKKAVREGYYTSITDFVLTAIRKELDRIDEERVKKGEPPL